MMKRTSDMQATKPEREQIERYKFLVLDLTPYTLGGENPDKVVAAYEYEGSATQRALREAQNNPKDGRLYGVAKLIGTVVPPTQPKVEFVPI